MKIIIIDNHGSETKSDVLIAENVPKHWADKIADAMNERYSGPTSPIFFQVTEDEYTLFVFEP